MKVMGCNTSSTAVGPLSTDQDGDQDGDQEARCDRCRSREDGPQVAVDEDGKDLPPAKKSREVREVPDGEDDGDGDEDEVVDIDLEDPEVEQAATKIQAAFRGHRARNSRTSTANMTTDEPTKQQLEAEFDPNDKELCHAATKIQASFRGHVARKTGPTKPDEEISKKMSELDTKDADEAAKLDDELADIDLTDPDLHKAATKIQASFRGHKVRKEGPDGAE